MLSVTGKAPSQQELRQKYKYKALPTVSSKAGAQTNPLLDWTWDCNKESNAI